MDIRLHYINVVTLICRYVIAFTLQNWFRSSYVIVLAAWVLRIVFPPQPPSLLIILPEPGWERKVLTKDTWFSFRRKWKSGNCSGSSFCPDQVLLSRNFHVRPDCRRRFLSKGFWVWGGGGGTKIGCSDNICLTFRDTLGEQVGLPDQSALIDVSLWKNPRIPFWKVC